MHEVQEALRLLKFEVTLVKEDFNSNIREKKLII